MGSRLYVGTRKGLFEIARRDGTRDVVDVQFLGDPVSAVPETTDGVLYAGSDGGSASGSPSCLTQISRIAYGAG